MKTETITLNGRATLKTYLWDDSEELKVKSRPAVLVIPGGGYLMCSDREAEPIALSFLAEGFNAFVLRYTVRDTFDKAFQDGEAALKTIRENTEEWNITENKIAVCGFSAGGHLACALGTISENKPAVMILGYPAVMGDFWKKEGQNVPDIIEKVSEKTCPAFVFAAADDNVVPINNSIALIDAMNRHGVKFESHIFHNGGHGFSLAKTHTANGESGYVNKRCEKWFSLSVEWLKETIGDVEIKKSVVMPENVSPLFNKKMTELLSCEKTKKVLIDFNPVFADEKIMGIAGNASLAEFIIAIGIDEEQILSLSEKLEG